MPENKVTRNGTVAALTFVVVARLILQGVAFIVFKPIFAVMRRLPETNTPGFPHVERLKAWIATNLKNRVPGWIDHHKGSMLLLKTKRGSDWLDQLVERTPDRLISGWLRFAITMMVVFLVGWAALLLVGIAFASRAAWYLSQDLLSWAVAYDWAQLFRRQTTPEYNPIEEIIQLVTSIPEILAALGVLAGLLAISLAIYWGFFLALLPGISLHEFGHYAAIRNAGVRVESYGLFLFGPVPMGAFVEPEEDFEDLSASRAFEIGAAGIGNSLLWGTTLLLVALVFSTDPVVTIQALYAKEYAVLATRPIPAVLFGMGLLEVANSFLNALPVGPVDGGKFIQTVEREWWGIDDESRFHERFWNVIDDYAPLRSAEEGT